MSAGDPNGKRWTERVGESPRWAGWSRLAAIGEAGIVSIAIAVVSWQAVRLLNLVEGDHDSIARVDSFVREALKYRDGLDAQLGAIIAKNQQQDGALANHETRLHCLEAGEKCP